eukprot:1000915-Prorocentrum_minimum.AAC.2
MESARAELASANEAGEQGQQQLAAKVRHQSRKGREYTRSEYQSRKGREYTRNGHQSKKGRENIPVAGTDHRRGERICP